MASYAFMRGFCGDKLFDNRITIYLVCVLKLRLQLLKAGGPQPRMKPLFRQALKIGGITIPIKNSESDKILLVSPCYVSGKSSGSSTEFAAFWQSF